jgi:hypothetical protein
MMGRPRKDGTQAEGTEQEEKEPDLMAEHTGLYTLKACPKCDSPAVQPYKDPHGLYRCSCSVCGFWDVIVNYTPEAAAKSWQQMGGPAVEW